MYHFFPHLLFYLKTSKWGKSLYFFLSNKWYWDWLFNQTLAKPLLHFGHIISYKTLDRGLFEALGPSGLIHSIQYITRCFSLLQSGYIYHYAFILFSATTLSLILINWFHHYFFDLESIYLLPLIALVYLLIPNKK
jgi:NADH:ubiquinone oxidoreductase subunit 5 (subunit L)/multisubunit Na+/H+ antiporter MnhA subunit